MDLDLSLTIDVFQDAKDDADFFTKICDWSKLHDFWVEKLWPYMRDELKVQALGTVGTGWGSWVATRYLIKTTVSTGLSPQLR